MANNTDIQNCKCVIVPQVRTIKMRSTNWKVLLPKKSVTRVIDYSIDAQGRRTPDTTILEHVALSAMRAAKKNRTWYDLSDVPVHDETMKPKNTPIKIRPSKQAVRRARRKAAQIPTESAAARSVAGPLEPTKR